MVFAAKRSRISSVLIRCSSSSASAGVTPATRARLDAAGVTSNDVQGVADLAKIPVLPKDSLVGLQQADPPFGGLLALPLSEIRHIFLSPGQSYCVMGRGRVVIEGATPSLNELRVHCPTAFLAARARPFLDRERLCKLTTALRWGRTTA